MSPPVRLVASDLDGTLLGRDHVVSDRTRQAIAAVAAHGVAVVAATGRSQWTAEPLLQGIEGLDLVVCSNGASLYDLRRRTSLAEFPIDDAVIDAVLAVLAAELPGCVYGWESADGLHRSAGFLEHRTSDDIAHPEPDLTPSPRAAPIRKLMVGHPEVQHDALLEVLLRVLPEGCTPSTSGAPFVEVTAGGVDKAFGVQRVCDALGIEAAEVVAFGDNHNDLPLLTWAGRGVAMRNARADVLAAVGEVTGRYDEDGVAQVLEALLDAAPPTSSS